MGKVCIIGGYVVPNERQIYERDKKHFRKKHFSIKRSHTQGNNVVAVAVFLV